MFNQKPHVMKKIIVVLVLLFANTTQAQKRMALIPSIPETVIGVEATPKIVDESFVFLLSQNNIRSFEVTEPFQVNPRVGELQKGVQYYFILSIQACEKCDYFSAKILGYTVSSRQNYKDIRALNAEFLTNTKE